MNTKRLNSPTFTRVAPFVAFMGFIAIEEGLRFLLSHQVISFDPTLLYWLYIPKGCADRTDSVAVSPELSGNQR